MDKDERLTSDGCEVDSSRRGHARRWRVLTVSGRPREGLDWCSEEPARLCLLLVSGALCALSRVPVTRPPPPRPAAMAAPAALPTLCVQYTGSPCSRQPCFCARVERAFAAFFRAQAAAPSTAHGSIAREFIFRLCATRPWLPFDLPRAMTEAAGLAARHSLPVPVLMGLAAAFAVFELGFKRACRHDSKRTLTDVQKGRRRPSRRRRIRPVLSLQTSRLARVRLVW